MSVHFVTNPYNLGKLYNLKFAKNAETCFSPRRATFGMAACEADGIGHQGRSESVLDMRQTPARWE